MADKDVLQTLEGVLDCLSGAVVVLDRSARVVLGNPGFSRLQCQNGVPPETTTEFLSLLRPQDTGFFMRHWKRPMGDPGCVSRRPRGSPAG